MYRRNKKASHNVQTFNQRERERRIAAMHDAFENSLQKRTVTTKCISVGVKCIGNQKQHWSIYDCNMGVFCVEYIDNLGRAREN